MGWITIASAPAALHQLGLVLFGPFCDETLCLRRSVPGSDFKSSGVRFCRYTSVLGRAGGIGTAGPECVRYGRRDPFPNRARFQEEDSLSEIFVV
jgi:hypothetical protein